MSNYFIRTGSILNVAEGSDIEVIRELPPCNYTVDQDQRSKQFFLRVVDDFTLPTKVYGNTMQQATRILNTFESRGNNTGVHLNGDKGSGKTVLARALSIEGKKRNLPTILINNGYTGDDFNKFMQTIDTPAIVVFDEFEKTYGYHDQQKILTLLDGVYQSKKLFVITTNDYTAVSGFLKNRPGRIYYSIQYKGVEPEFVEEYCNDNLNDKSQIKNILTFVKMYSFFNFDMLSAVVEEMNRYGETFSEVLKYLNIVPEMSKKETYTVSFAINGAPFVLKSDEKDFDPSTYSRFVYEEDIKEIATPEQIALFNRNGNKCDEDDFDYMLDDVDQSESMFEFNPNHLASFDQEEHKFTYVIERGGVKFELIVKRNAQAIVADFTKWF